MTVTKVVVVFALISIAIVAGYGYGSKSPVILIPGLGGSQIEAKVFIDGKKDEYCSERSEDYRLLWLNPTLMLPYVVDCLVNMMKLRRDPFSGLTYNSPGVHVRVPGWGETSSVEWISPIKLPPFSYYFPLVDGLVSRRGYRRGVDVRGAPYDFRKSPNEMSQYFTNLRLLIEETFRINGYQRVVLVCHSMGCPIILHFLQQHSQEWKDTHIKSFVNIAGAYTGAVITVKAMATGATMGIPTVDPNVLRRHQRTLPSSAYLLPRRPSWGLNEVVAMTDKRNYSISDYDQFFRDMNYPDAIPLVNDIINITDIQKAPGVPMHCVMTRHTPTVEIYDWRGLNWPDAEPREHHGEGDGTVNWKSLTVCEEYSKLQTQSVKTTMIEDTNHRDILGDQRLLEFMLDTVLDG